MKRNKQGRFTKISTAEKIRRAHAKGLSRTEISKTFGVKYQQVRNVLAKQAAATQA